MWNGIGVFNANHLTISNNVVQGYSDMESWIRTEYSDSVTLDNNQSQAFLFNADTNVSETSDQTVGAADPNSVKTGSTGGTTSTASTPPEPDAVTSPVTYTLGSASHSLTLTGTADIDGTGNDNGDAITGNVGSNHLTGGAGNDTISDGGVGGADTMAGKAGDDVYYVNNTADVIIENAGEGTDTVNSSVTYTLSPNVENLVLTGTANIDGTGNDNGDAITGNVGANHLTGGAGADTISDGGGTGADTMAGKAGDDTYFVNKSDRECG
jgi:Ca2+-binding RTX toxin-like protein